MSHSAERLRVWQGDITGLAFAAIVNAANESLLGGGGVDGAIHRAAGPALKAHCAALGGCPTGEARITPGFRLAARHIIHTVGPVWCGGNRGEAQQLSACYRSVFALAREHRLGTIAIPAISCGVYGYPRAQAATIAVAQCRLALAENPVLRELRLVAYDEEMYRIYATAIAAAG